jgi:hypothetical protein
MVVYCNDVYDYTNFDWWFKAGNKLVDGMDVTDILATPHTVYDDHHGYSLCGGYEGKYTAHVIQAQGIGGGNPYIRFLWNSIDDLKEWYVDRVGGPMGLNREDSIEELDYILGISK